MMMGRGIVNPVDMDHGANPPSHPELLDCLAAEFVAHKYDVKRLVRQIALSDTYQRSSEVPPALSDVPADRYLVATMKPLTPEQLAYAVMQATGQTDSQRAKFAKLGPKTMEEQLDAQIAPRVPPFRSMFSARAGSRRTGSPRRSTRRCSEVQPSGPRADRRRPGTSRTDSRRSPMPTRSRTNCS